MSAPGFPSITAKAWGPVPGPRRSQATAGIPRALACITLAGLAVLFLWLTIKVDLVIFAGVLFGICLRRAAEGLSRRAGLWVGWSLVAVVILIIAFFAGFGWLFAQTIAGQINQLSQQLPAAVARVGNMISQSSLGQTCCSVSAPTVCTYRRPTCCKASSGWRSTSSRWSAGS